MAKSTKPQTRKHADKRQDRLGVSAPRRGRRMRILLRKHQIYVPPVLCGAGAFAGPAGIVVQMIRHLRGPEATDVAVIDVALHRLAESGSSPGRVDFPSGREHE